MDTIYEDFCEEFQDEYQEWLFDRSFEDTDESKEVFAHTFANGLAFANFEYNYNESLELNEADNYNDSRKTAGEF